MGGRWEEGGKKVGRRSPKKNLPAYQPTSGTWYLLLSPFLLVEGLSKAPQEYCFKHKARSFPPSSLLPSAQAISPKSSSRFSCCSIKTISAVWCYVTHGPKHSFIFSCGINPCMASSTGEVFGGRGEGKKERSTKSVEGVKVIRDLRYVG